MKSRLSDFVETVDGFIDSDMEFSIQMNKYYIIISSILIFILLLISVYFLAFMFHFRNQVLIFFADMDRDSCKLSELSASSFHSFMVTDNYDLLKNH